MAAKIVDRKSGQFGAPETGTIKHTQNGGIAPAADRPILTTSCQKPLDLLGPDWKRYASPAATDGSKVDRSLKILERGLPQAPGFSKYSSQPSQS
jgi:hypothetical protein